MVEHRVYGMAEALEVVRKAAFAKFDETLEVSLRRRRIQQADQTHCRLLEQTEQLCTQLLQTG